MDQSSAPLAGASPAPNKEKGDVFAGQVALLYRHGTLSNVVTLVLSAVLAIVNWQALPHVLLSGWLVAIFVLILLRAAVVRAYRLRVASAPNVRLWAWLYIAIVAATGAAWGTFGVLMIPLQSLELKVFSVLVICGVAAGAVPVLAAVRLAAAAFVLAAVLPTAAVFLAGDEGQSLALGMTALIFAAGMIVSAWFHNRIVIDSLWLRLHNDELLDRTIQQKTAADSLNSELQLVAAERQRAQEALLDANQNLESRVQKRTAELEWLAHHDTLTQLPNRQLLRDRLQHAIATAHRRDERVAVLYLDLDRFKLINDSLGHDAGDELLQRVAERLRECIRDSDTVARIGGDEFVLVLEGISAGNQASSVADKILTALAAPFSLQGQSFVVSASIGISQCPNNGTDAPSLMQNADRALHRAKRDGRNNYVTYNSGMNVETHERLALEQGFATALENDELALFYQPMVELGGGTVVGFEALLRWRHPQRGVLTGNQLIPLAEDTGTIVRLGEWVLRTACLEAKKWQIHSEHGLQVSVNLSARQFLQADLCQQVRDVLRETEFAAHCLTLEITEGMLMQDVAHVSDVLRELKGMGVKLAVDDFGTGYSSFGHLKRFPLDWLKIDHTFVHEATREPNDAAIVTATIHLAHSLGLRVLVEGVETATQLAFVQGRRADVAQGYYMQEPMAAEEIDDWLSQPTLPDTLSTGGSKSVLVLDDEEADSELFSMLLRREGYHAVTAQSAEQALELLAQRPMDVLVVDYTLPGIDGVDFLRRARAIYPDTMRIMISARADETVVARAMQEAGVFRFLSKPVSEQDLCAAVEEALSVLDQSTCSPLPAVFEA